MNRLEKTFKSLRAQKRKALIAYVTGGFPSMGAMGGILRQLERAGADVVEIGVPFSDPIADGPTIQFSSQAALDRGARLSNLLSWMKKFRRRSQLPVVFMSYLNPIERMGYDRFAHAARESGVDGLIVPDLIPEEAGALQSALRRRGLDMIYLVAPTTPPARQKMIARKTAGFLYAVSVTGVTGARRSLPSDVRRFAGNLRRLSRAPVALGFGIASPEHVRRYASAVDGIIVGSAIIQRLRDKKPLRPFVASLRRALDQTIRGGKSYAG